ncbi:sigma-70 family RNA polymerase sigma factor [Occallatibacter savannae]|uniref:RNA polymerase sigma factor n=1 Tax=Occallatibacter savannae TaxID=1002691 RepID=UPI0013A59EB4
MQDARSNHARSEEVFDGVVSTDLLQSAQAGSHPAFETLHRTYSRRLFKQIIAITRHPEDAEDALQDALCKAYIALPLFERRCHVYSWLSRIAINAALMKVRQRRTSRESSFDGQDDEDGREHAFEVPDQGWSPEDLYGAKESLRHIGTAISSLDSSSQQIIRLRVNHGYSMEEIANALNVSESAVKARLYRARLLLRDLYPAARCKGR